MTYNKKLAILKTVGDAQEKSGVGIYGFSLNYKRRMMFYGKTWDEAVKLADSKNWFDKFDKNKEE